MVFIGFKMLRNKFNDIFHNVQQNVSSHQKYRQILLNLYKEVPFEDFEIELMRIIELLFCRDITPKNVFVNRSLEFIGSFVGNVINEGAQLEANTSTNNVFLESILTNIICYHNVDNISVRFHCCQLIHLLFSSLGENVLIDSELWDVVSHPLLERLKDIKPNIRVQAAHALSRFQLPNDPTCKVVSAFLDRLYDINASVRKEIVHLIAPTKLTFPKIAERVKDVDHGVRLVAFRKCATVGPKVFMINTRQSILMNGFNERNNIVKIYVQEELVPSWLSSYNGDFLKFLDALKLDSCEEDIKHSEIICNRVLQLFFKTHQFGTIIEKFPLDENKVIPMDKLNYQSSLLWHCLVDYLRELDDSEDHLDLIIPELTLFCAYIERVVDENCKVEGWKFYEHQHNLLQLFKIAKTYDFSDEVGRKCLRKLVVDLLTTKKLSERVILTMITILSLINPNLDVLTSDICHIISEISEPMVVQIQPTESEIMHRNYQLAQLNVKINVLKENSEEAILKKDFKEAGRIKTEIEIIQKKHDDLTSEFNKQAAKPIFNEVDVTLRCLDILIGMLSLPALKTLTISLRTCKDEFLPPLFDLDNSEIGYKLFKCLSLFCTLDRAVAQQHLKALCTPLFLYRITPHDNLQNLLISIATVSDLLRLFGLELLRNDGLDDTATNTSLRHHNGTRRLYTIEQSGTRESMDDLITSDNIFDILLELMDDEQAELRHQAARALSELVMAKVTLSPTIISRMILKWLLSALDEREEIKLQQIIGNALFYVMKLEEGVEIYERTVIPVLNCIGNAPRTSPLADIDIENAVTFLSALTSIQSETQFVNIHKNLAYNLCYKIRDKADDKNVPLYIRMLAALHLDLDNPCNVRELIDQAEGILEKITEKMSKKHLEKFLLKLKQMLNEENNEEDKNPTNGKTNENEENELVNVQIGNASESAVDDEKPKENSLVNPQIGNSIESPGDNEKNKENSLVNHQIGNANESLETVNETASVTKKGKGGKVKNVQNKVKEKPDQRKSPRQSRNRRLFEANLLPSGKNSLQFKCSNNKKSQPVKLLSKESPVEEQVTPMTRKSVRQAKGPDLSPPAQNKKKNTIKRVQRLASDSVSSLTSTPSLEELNPRKSLRLSQNSVVITPSPKSFELNTRSSKRVENSNVNTSSQEPNFVEELNPKKSLRLSQNSVVITPSPKSFELNTRSSKRVENSNVNTSSQEPRSTRKSSKSTNPVNSPLVRSSVRLSNKTPRNVHNSSVGSDTPQVKRRKKRGKKLSGDSATSIGSRYSDQTILHTIVHDDETELEKLADDEDMSILTPTTTESQSSRSSTRSKTSRLLAVTDTSSDSGSPQRKSVRKKKMNLKYYNGNMRSEIRRKT